MKNKMLLLFLLIRIAGFAQIDSTDFIVKKMMKDQRITGLTLAVVKNGKAVVKKGYGLANVELNIPVTSETVIRLGSVSKQFFATAILKLAEDGQISIEDSVHKFFPDAPETWRPIQVKHLLSHSSGLVREGPAYNNNIIQPDLTIIRSAYSLPLNFKTGAKYQYCNLAYFMLAEIIRQVSKRPWQDYIRDSLFIPAGMKNSGMTDFYPIIPNRASGYMHKGDTLLNANAMYAVRPSGGFLSTSNDMILWDKVLYGKKIILKEQNWDLLWKPFIKLSDKPESKTFYGFGWLVDEANGHRLVSHGGSNTGFRSQYSRYIDDGLSIIILTNTDEAEPAVIAKVLAEYYFRKHLK
ncbi:MAG: serine hydrolase domain-containing protein [Chitinophagaceae bacterium]